MIEEIQDVTRSVTSLFNSANPSVRDLNKKSEAAINTLLRAGFTSNEVKDLVDTDAGQAYKYIDKRTDVYAELAEMLKEEAAEAAA